MMPAGHFTPLALARYCRASTAATKTNIIDHPPDFRSAYVMHQAKVVTAPPFVLPQHLNRITLSVSPSLATKYLAARSIVFLVH
jgi:hypothetical protein